MTKKLMPAVAATGLAAASGREVTAGAGYSAGWVISSMDAHASGTLSKAGEKPGTYVVFSGVKKASGYYKAKTCNSKAHSWNVQAEGAVKCSEKPKSGTVKLAAKKGYC
ncbi:hypothetical protein [Streptomyces sp. NPDC087317]|uniref:hypothetical protein n=1 Tax=Streptomyces sp. NPDC087317 TaxID=3365784 RepID=UPI0037FEF9B8